MPFFGRPTENPMSDEQDSREVEAEVEFDVGDELYPNDHWFKVVKALRIGAVKVLKENPKVSNPYPNVDAISGSLLTAAGLENPDYYTLLFGWSRVAGIACQIVDERNFPGKKDGLPIYRPKYYAVDQPAR